MDARSDQTLRWGTLALVLMLVFGGADAADEAVTIRDTFSRLLSGKGTPEDTGKDFLILVETLGQMAEQTKPVPPDVRTKIREALKAYRKDPSIKGPGSAVLYSAWGGYSSGRPYSLPEGVKDRATATKEIQLRVDSCLTAMENDDGALAVKDLLEAMLMVITPIPESAVNG